MRKTWGAMILALVCVTPAGAEYEAGQRDAAIAEWRAGAEADEAEVHAGPGPAVSSGFGRAAELCAGAYVVQSGGQPG